MTRVLLLIVALASVQLVLLGAFLRYGNQPKENHERDRIQGGDHSEQAEPEPQAQAVPQAAAGAGLAPRQDPAPDAGARAESLTDVEREILEAAQPTPEQAPTVLAIARAVPSPRSMAREINRYLGREALSAGDVPIYFNPRTTSTVNVTVTEAFSTRPRAAGPDFNALRRSAALHSWPPPRSGSASATIRALSR